MSEISRRTGVVEYWSSGFEMLRVSRSAFRVETWGAALSKAGLTLKQSPNCFMRFVPRSSNPA
jgi:hypothetical protein